MLDLLGSFASKRAVWPYMAVPPKEAGQVDFSLPAIVVGMQVHLLIFEGSPQSLHQDVVLGRLWKTQAFRAHQKVVIAGQG